MAYTAAAIALYFNNDPRGVRICLTGSFYVIEHPESDASMNLEAALETVVSQQLPPGVYVAFRSNQTVVNIYHGLEVSPMGHNSKTFCAMYGKAAAAYVNGQIRNTQPRHINLMANCNLPSTDKLRLIGQKIYQIMSYPGLDLSIFAIRSDRRLIIMDSYHSGTAASGTIIDFREKSPNVEIAMSCFSTKYLRTPYQSTLELIKAGVHVYTDIGSLHLYVLAACRYAADIPFDDLLDPVSAYLLTGGKIELHGQ